MRGIDELDHYELLEIARSATQSEIDRAYRMAQRTYADGSLALYSVFENTDASAIRDRFDEAYRVLSDDELRAGYDDEIAIEEKISEKTLISSGRYAPGQTPSEEVVISFDTPAGTSFDASGISGQSRGVHGEAGGHGSRGTGQGTSGVYDSYAAIDTDTVEGAVEEFDAIEDDGRGEFDGVRLRRNRLFRGYEIDDISDVTKVNSTHLRNIEEENFRDLPADVYVRGFVTAYAQTIGLDPSVVVPSYMARVEQSRGNPERASFLARR